MSYMTWQVDQLKGQIAHLRARAERADADNAALLTALQWAESELSDVLCRRYGIHAALRSPHPGAAMLERLRALERVLADAVEWMRQDGGAKERGEPCRHSGSCKWQRADAILVRASGALKGES